MPRGHRTLIHLVSTANAGFAPCVREHVLFVEGTP